MTRDFAAIERKAGKAEGAEEREIAIINNMKKLGKSAEEIAQLCAVDIKKVQRYFN